ncbi:DnaJ protein [Nitzschia inconspicua]|uniref:DnaJ protein n=1 Tax=Nitzschia inconspicua TaxID=303405 RepID=A0A9K3PI83_9STRA|nr:DnaJ protein [Nitzschia inconspicua]
MPSTSPSKKQQKEDEEYYKARDEVEYILGVTKPKHLGEGLTSGVGYILRGAVGAAGAIVLCPTIGLGEGHKEAGVFGGVVGGVTGAAAGIVQAANVLGGGIVTGVGQIARGIAATPNAVIAPTRGCWWNPNEGVWVKTNLLEEERWIKDQPEFDQDILGDEVIPEDHRPKDDNNLGIPTKKVKDTYYYDKLGLDPGVDSDMIKRRYYIIARKYSPDRAGANKKAQNEFQEIGRAYTILMNPDLRAKYDRVGRETLWEDEEEPPDVDPFMLYTLLFGSEKFNDYIGKLAAVTSARVGDEKHKKITMAKARLLQKRRVTRLALKLAERLQKWAEDDLQSSALADWAAEAENLCDASYGVELVHVIGKVYTLSAVQFLGALNKGVGMPSISDWARKHSEGFRLSTEKLAHKVSNMGGDKDKVSLHQHVATAIEKSEGDSDLEDLAMDALKKSRLHKTALNLLWKQTVVDITSTIHESAQMVLNDHSVPSDIRKRRAKALEACGGIFEKAVRASGEQAPSQQEELEKVAFNAMLNTVWQQEMATRLGTEE